MSTIAVVGAGAMGGLWAARLSLAGHDVTVVDVSDETLAAVRTEGLTLVKPSGDSETAQVAATGPSREPLPHDIVFVFVKGPHTSSAASTLAALAHEGTVVATLQNGWGNADVLAAHIDSERLVVGVTYQSATVVRPGSMRHGGTGPSHVGPYLPDGPMEPAERVARAMGSAGLECEATEAVLTHIWRKLVHNAACLPVSALTGLRAAPLVQPGGVRDLIDDLAREAVAVGRAEGHVLDIDERIERIHAVLGSAGMGVPSMLADVLAGRPTEIDTVNGAVVRAARARGIETPLNDAMVALVRGLERRATSSELDS